MMRNPFTAEIQHDQKDASLAASAASGDKQALEKLIRRHQGWIYNLAVRMVLNPQNAQDITQEALLRIITRIAQFEGRSSFRTWAYRIVTNCFLDSKRGPIENVFSGFDDYGDDLDAIPNQDLRLAPELEPDRALIIEEAKLGCMLGMLMCLNRDQRMVYILADIFEAPAPLAAEILNITPGNFRQKLSRARRDLRNFMNDKCGLVDPTNPCRCERKASGFMKQGWLDPQKLKFSGEHLQRMKTKAKMEVEPLDQFADKAYGQLYRQHPLQEPLEGAGAGMDRILVRLLDSSECHQIFDL
ncbi:RNA polymerase sigma factor [Photobacterium sp. OFAV2-7]|uniref:RNA polymerase sigma factor n=1 Tax=Photobacterium sp. OFAV2-7 TaxID=2917748 RepID=UPI001EF55AD3|nr:RNA polymerase sigma factor [Photobacterium sp. OFAV2-7]MCG7585755.1 RNA polymerase sigma factor [Photobacterium sp. OFAV2-7]